MLVFPAGPRPLCVRPRQRPRHPTSERPAPGPHSGVAVSGRRLASFDYDLVAWRENQEGKVKGNKEWNEGFAMMDLDGGAAWDLVTQVPLTLNALSPKALNPISFRDQGGGARFVPRCRPRPEGVSAGVLHGIGPPQISVFLVLLGSHVCKPVSQAVAYAPMVCLSGVVP